MILMDIQMPEMDGIEATQMIRERLGNDIPIIAVTANAIKEELEYYLKKGLSDYLTKPFEERKLLEKIQQFTKS
jgi:CheY-like chemotaxis protein